MADVKAGLKRLDELTIENGDDPVSFNKLYEILSAELEWKESVEKRIAELEKYHADRSCWHHPDKSKCDICKQYEATVGKPSDVKTEQTLEEGMLHKGNALLILEIERLKKALLIRSHKSTDKVEIFRHKIEDYFKHKNDISCVVYREQLEVELKQALNK